MNVNEKILMKRSGVNIMVEPKDVQMQQKNGFAIVDVPKEEDKKRTFSTLKIDELKLMAEENGVEIEGLNKKETAAAIKEALEEEEITAYIEAL